jgi:hypothetical protein
VNHRHLRQALLLGSVALAPTGCAWEIDQELAQASVSSALGTAQNSRMTRTVSDNARSEGCLDPSAAAAEAAARPTPGLYPEGCVIKTTDGPSLHVEYDDCTGPFGHLHLMGGVDAELSETSCNVLHAAVADSGDLTANEEDVAYTAEADITVEGDLRRLAYTGDWVSKTRRGDEVAITADLDIVVDRATDCLQVSGVSSGHVGKHDFEATTQGYEVCPGACPSAGRTEVQVELFRDRTIVVEFDGSEIAQVSVDGEAHEVTMVCAGEDTDIEPSTERDTSR